MLLESAKEEWIRINMALKRANEKEDYIIGFYPYGYDEEIHENKPLKIQEELKTFKGGETIGGKTLKTKGKSSNQMIRRSDMTDRADWEIRFGELLELNLIQLPDEYYEDELYFKNTEDLEDLFTDLEEKNLSLINKIQEVDESLEKT